MTDRRAALVEDNLLFGTPLEASLRSLGFTVSVFDGGESLAERVAAWRPEVVFVNLASGRWDGAEVVRQLRAQGVPAIVGYAGHVERDRFAAGREAGADLVVPNSAMRRSLPEVLEKLERRRQGAAGEEAWELP